MNKNAKSSTKMIFLILGVALIILAFTKGNLGLFAVGLYDKSVEGSCTDALNKYTYNADQGECYIGVQNNQQLPIYVSSVVEKTSLSGSRTTCIISATSNVNEVTNHCTQAQSSDGVVKICSKDSDCTSLKCTNHMCEAGQPRTCSTIGAISCISDSVYQKCLSNGRWSGNLHCFSGTSCTSGTCFGGTSGTSNPNSGTPSDSSTNNNTGGSTNLFGNLDQMALIMLIIGGVLILVALMG